MAEVKFISPLENVVDPHTERRIFNPLAEGIVEPNPNNYNPLPPP